LGFGAGRKTYFGYEGSERGNRFDNPEGIAYFLASQEFDEEEIWLPERYLNEAQKIAREEINGLVKEIFNYSKVNICLLGKIPPEILKEVEKIYQG